MTGLQRGDFTSPLVVSWIEDCERLQYGGALCAQGDSE